VCVCVTSNTSIENSDSACISIADYCIHHFLLSCFVCLPLHPWHTYTLDSHIICGFDLPIQTLSSVKSVYT
jgi:hypothetical protein